MDGPVSLGNAEKFEEGWITKPVRAGTARTGGGRKEELVQILS